ncbi:MAG: hypothetical protein HY319_21430 [Armatimonadetes bacterium]|nr:hypothetical protein [Armatimonadota bacterium]
MILAAPVWYTSGVDVGGGRTRGLTLGEVLVSLALLLILAVVVMGVFSKLLSSSAKTADLTIGRVLAGRVLEKAIRSGPPEFGLPSGTGSSDIYSHDPASRTTFVYALTPTKLQDGLPTRPMGDLWHLEVQVHWWTDQPSTRPGMGRLSTSVEEVVFIQE